MKGISPLVAAVLLIAVTMTIAGLLAYWASSFVRERVEQWEEEAPVAECTFANFKIEDCTNDGLGNITLILNNIKNIELKNITAYIRFTNDTISEPITNLSPDNTLPGNLIKTFKFTSPETTWKKVTIKTHCPEISASHTC